MTKYWRVVALLAAMVLVLAACGGDDTTDDTEAGAEDTTTTEAAEETTTTEEEMDEETTTTEAADGGDEGDMDGPFVPTGLPEIDPLAADPANNIGIAGSSTVFPLSTAIMTRWEDEGGPNYPIDSIGSGGGLERFCVEGASDIANASRAIEDEEIAACEEIGRTIIPVRVGSDALTLVVSPNAPDEFKDLTIEQIATAFSLTGSDPTWADVDPSFPAHPIAAFTPGEDSGTFDYFNEVIFDEAEPSPILSAGPYMQVVGETDETTVAGVAGDGCQAGDTSTTCAIGYFGFAFFAENQGELAAVAVDGVEPNEDTVADGSYPIARPLFMYTAEEVLDEKPWVANWMAYYLQVVNEEIDTVGYFPAPDENLQEAADNIAPFVDAG